ncbi:DUF6541 family protein [Bifidobacterium panos]|uniref:Transmembrane protein alanine and leucine rich n=1 Tax=Bifidobacterium panos TaxID=2675321 RepID=A0ABX1SX34_9BIFI|nr:DUF6541 family protein [Bifidobacterium sp. DSM 109963]NMN01824.1 hypothetical protein [Bifidobacterium sp. DSM 109963]
MQLATWLEVVPMMLVIAAGLYVPGALIVAVAGGKSPLRVAALAPVASMAVAGVGGILVYQVHIRWGWVCYLLSALIVLMLIAAVRFAIARRRATAEIAGAETTGTSETIKTDSGTHSSPSRRLATSRSNPSQRRRDWKRLVPALAGVVIAAASVIVRLVHAMPSPDQITQTYDTVFHDNVVARIVQTGEASSLHALPPIRDVYPIAFQQFAALGKMAMPAATAPAAITCAWLVFAALVWPISILFLTREVCGDRVLPSFLAPVLAVCVAGGPFVLLDWGTLYSMYAGQTLLPVLLALAWRWCLKDWNRGARTCVSGLAWIAVAALAVSLAHFRVIMTFLLVAVPLALVWLWAVAQTLKRAKGVRAMRLVVVAFVAVVLVVFAAGCAVFARMYIFDSTRPISDHLNGGPAQPTENIPSAIARFLTGTPITSANQRLVTDWVVVVLLLVAVIGIITLARNTAKRNGLLLLAGFLLLGLVFVSCAGTHADWAKVLTALWYKDQRRPFSAWPMMAVPIICLGWQMLCDGIGARAAKPSMKPSAALASQAARLLAAALAVLVCAASPQMAGMMGSVANVTRFAANGQDTPMLTSDEYLLLKRLNKDVPADDEIIADPWNGSAFSLAVGNRTPYYAHLSMAWDQDHFYLANNLKNIDTDPQVCQILNRNDLKWYLSMGGPYVKGDPNQKMFDGLKVVEGAMQEVDRQGDAALYRITACE